MSYLDLSLHGDRAVALGLFSKGHLGDALCTTPMPRLLQRYHQKQVFVASHSPVLRSVFQNNPFVRGFVDGPGLQMIPQMRGFGHLIQRLQQGFDLPIDRVPKPELYLSEAEREWARRQRAIWPSDKPICIVSTRVVTDLPALGQVDWHTIGTVLANHFTIIQPVLTSRAQYAQEIDTTATGGPWSSEPTLPGAIIYTDLPLRQYLVLFSVANCFCGGTSGGAHVAAAFGLPALIVVWRAFLNTLKFPVSDQSIGPHLFVYPQHQFLATEDVDSNDLRILCSKVAHLFDLATRPDWTGCEEHLAEDLLYRARSPNRILQLPRGRVAAVRFFV